MKKSLLNNIENALEEIRPFLKNDGGDISLVGIEKDTVKVKFEGACSTSVSYTHLTLPTICSV